MQPRPLPDGLSAPFLVADARRLGVSSSRLRASDLCSPFFGTRATKLPHADGVEESVRRRALEYEPAMRSTEFFCLVTAAVLWGVPLPRAAFRIRTPRGDFDERPLDVGVLLPARAARGAGVLGRSVRPGWAAIRTEAETGLRLTSPASTWAMLGSLLSVSDLVAVGDALVREPMRRGDPPALATIDQLTRASSVGRRVGINSLRAALPLIRTRSRSRKETETRLALAEAGLREPELNCPVEVDGAVVALIDLAYPELRLGFEYEGEHHLLDPEQWAADIRRYEVLTGLGWRIIRVTKSDLDAGRQAFIGRARRAYTTAAAARQGE